MAQLCMLIKKAIHIFPDSMKEVSFILNQLSTFQTNFIYSISEKKNKRQIEENLNSDSLF